MMKHVKVAAIATLLVISTVAIARAGTPEDISTTVVLDRAHLLSSQKATATLSIANQSTAPVFFSPSSVSFLEFSGSTWRPLQRLRSITMPERAVRIDARSRFTTALELPSCAVYSDPCTEDVVVQYTILANSQAAAYSVQLPRYEFEPDPAATYDVAGLTGNRPVFIAYGMARDTVYPDTLVVECAASPSEVKPPFTSTPRLVSELALTFTRAGVALGNTGFDTDGTGWKAVLQIRDASKQSAAIANGLNAVRNQFRGRVSSIVQYVVYDPRFDDTKLYERAETDAHARAERLAESVGSDDVEQRDQSRSGFRTYLGNAVADFPLLRFDEAAPADKPVVLNQSAAVPTAIQTVLQGLYLGSRPVNATAERSILEHAGKALRAPNVWLLPLLTPDAVIAADRPELYVTGVASAKAARGAGLEPDFAAVLDARERILRLADVLAVHPEHESLFAAYPLASDSDPHTIGVATTFTGGETRRRPNISVQPNVDVYRSDDARLAAMVPIAVPDPNKTITAMATATVTQRPDAVRLDVEIVQARSTAPDLTPVAGQDMGRRLRRLPAVFDVASTTTTDSVSLRSRYEVLLRNPSTTSLQAVLAVLRSAYAPFHPSVTFEVGGVMLDCGKIELRLLKATIRENWLQAKGAASATHTDLRKLLLAAALPMNVQNFSCQTRAQAPDSLKRPDPAPELPGSTAFSLTALMQFRTSGSAAAR